MECPTCHSLLTEGEVSLEFTLTDLVVGGGIFPELRFRKPNQGPVTILTPSNSKPGLFCNRCGFVAIINDPEFTDTECIKCRSAMPAGVTSCPSCGWTYKENG